MLPRVWDAAAEAFRDHFGGHDFSEAARQRWLDDPLMEPELLRGRLRRRRGRGRSTGCDRPRRERGQRLPLRLDRPGLHSSCLASSRPGLRAAGALAAAAQGPRYDLSPAGGRLQNENRALALYERHNYEVDRSASEWHRPWSHDREQEPRLPATPECPASGSAHTRQKRTCQPSSSCYAWRTKPMAR